MTDSVKLINLDEVFKKGYKIKSKMGGNAKNV